MRLLNGILGTGVNKVGNVIGATWKGIAYVRQYSIPKNPNTVAQQAVRLAMRQVGMQGGSMLASVIQKFWDPIATRMSGYNLFVQVNRTAKPLPYDWKKHVGVIGKNEQPSAVASEYDAVAGEVTVTWPSATLGVGLADDKALVIVYDTVNNVSFVSDGNAIRNDQLAIIDVGTGRVHGDLYAYLAFYRGDAKPYFISTSIGTDTTLKPIVP